MEANRSSPVFFNDKVLQYTSVHAMQWQVESSDREFQFSKQFQFSFSWIIPKFAVPGINILLLSEFHGTGNPKTRGTIFLSALYYYCLELWQSVLKDTYNKPNFNVLLLCMIQFQLRSSPRQPPGNFTFTKYQIPWVCLTRGGGWSQFDLTHTLPNHWNRHSSDLYILGKTLIWFAPGLDLTNNLKHSR